jgi:hypothetical protein
VKQWYVSCARKRVDGGFVCAFVMEGATREGAMRCAEAMGIIPAECHLFVVEVPDTDRMLLPVWRRLSKQELESLPGGIQMIGDHGRQALIDRGIATVVTETEQKAGN